MRVEEEILAKTPEINFDTLFQNILWVHDFYDWPLSGAAILDGKRIWFSCIDENDDYERRFGIYDVPNNTWKTIDECHDDFVKYVGPLWEYIDGKCCPYLLRPESEHDKFYSKWKGKTDPQLKVEWLIGVADSSKGKINEG